MRTSFVRYVSPTPRHTSFRKERAIVGAARGRSASAIPDLELIHPGVSDLNRETPFGNSTGILGIVCTHLLCADTGAPSFRLRPRVGVRREFGDEEVRVAADARPCLCVDAGTAERSGVIAMSV